MRYRMKSIFNERDFTSVLEIDKNLFDFNKLRNLAKDKNLFEKKELHVTLIGRETGELIKDSIEKLQKPSELVNKIKKLVYKTKWKVNPINKIYFISKIYKEYSDEKRGSLVQFVHVPSIKSFYKKLNKISRMNLKHPLSHVTLFTNSSKRKTRLRGIGIYSIKQFKTLKPKLIK